MYERFQLKFNTPRKTEKNNLPGKEKKCDFARI